MKLINEWGNNLWSWLECSWELYIVLFFIILMHSLLFSSLGYINVFLVDLIITIIFTLIITFSHNWGFA